MHPEEFDIDLDHMPHSQAIKLREALEKALEAMAYYSVDKVSQMQLSIFKQQVLIREMDAFKERERGN